MAGGVCDNNNNIVNLYTVRDSSCIGHDAWEVIINHCNIFCGLHRV